MFSGPVLSAEESLRTGEPTPDSPLGPLRLRQAWVRSSEPGTRWHVAIENPTTSPFGVTIVLRLVDADGTTGAWDSVSFELERGETREIDREVGAVPPAIGGWSLEAWVRVLPAPDRRTLGGTS